jgi:predicted phosphohydrolase
MIIGFDVISDLNLTPDESFNWENKATSLYCIIAGNISNDIRTIHQTLTHLSRFYQGIFYIAGSLEYPDINVIPVKSQELVKICRTIRNVAYLQNHIVIIDGVAIIGSNGWYGNTIFKGDVIEEMTKDASRNEDLSYLSNSLEKLQLHLDVKAIIIVTNSVPGPELFFGEDSENLLGQLPPQLCLVHDTEGKVSHWIYGSYEKIVDTTIHDINYINNSYYKRNPYWAKRIAITV